MYTRHIQREAIGQGRKGNKNLPLPTLPTGGHVQKSPNKRTIQLNETTHPLRQWSRERGLQSLEKWLRFKHNFVYLLLNFTQYTHWGCRHNLASSFLRGKRIQPEIKSCTRRVQTQPPSEKKKRAAVHKLQITEQWIHKCSRVSSAFPQGGHMLTRRYPFFLSWTKVRKIPTRFPKEKKPTWEGRKGFHYIFKGTISWPSPSRESTLI